MSNFSTSYPNPMSTQPVANLHSVSPRTSSIYPSSIMTQEIPNGTDSVISDSFPREKDSMEGPTSNGNPEKIEGYQQSSDRLPVHKGTSEIPPESKSSGDEPFGRETADFSGSGNALELQIKLKSLEEVNAQLMELNAVLEGSSDKSKEEIESLKRKLASLNQEKDESTRKLILRNRKLNDMIIANSPKSDEPMDDDILTEIYKIRNQVTTLVRIFFAVEPKFFPKKAAALGERYVAFYDRYRASTHEGRRRLLISLIFTNLQDYFFTSHAKRFGTDSESEKYLQIFERQMETCRDIEPEELIAWRAQTVKLALRLNVSAPETVYYTAQRIAAHLEPVVLSGPQGDTPAGRDNLFESLKPICAASLALALSFRASRTRYEFKVYQDHTLLDHCKEDLITVMNAEGPVNQPIDKRRVKIFCTLWGALVKTRSGVAGENGESVVLDKGHVIVYEPPSGQFVGREGRGPQ